MAAALSRALKLPGKMLSTAPAASLVEIAPVGGGVGGGVLNGRGSVCAEVLSPPCVV